MDLMIAIGALVLVGLLIVGLFHGPSHRDAGAHRRRGAPTATTTPAEPERTSEAPAAAPIVLPPGPTESPTDPPAYVLPPPRRRRPLPRRPVNGPRGRRS